MTQSIGSFARNIIATQANLSNAQVLELVKQQFPDAKTSIACIAWYKSNMKKTGYKVASVVVERNIEMIQAELEAAKMKVLELEDELETKVATTREQMQAQFEALAKQLGISINV